MTVADLERSDLNWGSRGQWGKPELWVWLLRVSVWGAPGQPEVLLAGVGVPGPLPAAVGTLPNHSAPECISRTPGRAPALGLQATGAA